MLRELLIAIICDFLGFIRSLVSSRLAVFISVPLSLIFTQLFFKALGLYEFVMRTLVSGKRIFQVSVIVLCIFMLSLLLCRTIASVFRSIVLFKRPLTRAPGMYLLTVADFIFRPTTVELTFRPLIAEWQSEYFEALKQGRKYKARWITIRYRFAFACTFIKAMGLSKVFSVFKQISK